jgi:very-short-patch-repair endonuclease
LAEHYLTTPSRRANHVRWCIDNPKHDEYIDNLNIHLDNARRTVISTPEEVKRRALLVSQRHKEGRYEQAHKDRIGKTGKKHTPETKARLSNIRKEWLKNNPDKHPWKRPGKNISKPCEDFKQLLTNNEYEYTSEFQPLQTRYFSIDIVFPQYKVGIEINGNQHYNRDGTLKTYYQNRHDLIVTDGWVLFELPYYEVYSQDSVDIMMCLLDNLLILNGNNQALLKPHS